jgi:serine/threonine protein kinase
MIGTVLGNRYEILTEIGNGGMARVYKAKDRYLQRTVAIKVLKDEFREDSEFLKRFDTEAQAAASLTHPNIVQIYDVGRDSNRYYIVMEHVDGITLKEYIANKGSLDWRETVDISIQICSALSKAHSRNIVHRDIKPNNILMTSDGVPKVADFGIARSASTGTDTMTIDTIGSVHYSSPEQVRGGYIDAQSDIYSIGVTMFEMVTGELPFDGETPVAVALKHIQDIPPVPSSIKKGIPRALDDIILTAMAKSRQDRYATVSELISDLENIRSNQSSTEIVVPNIKHESKYDTKKIEKPLELEEDLIMSGKKQKTSKKKNREASESSSRKIVMPIVYILLIATILGSLYYFITMIAREFINDSINAPKQITLGNYVNRHIDDVKKELEAEGLDLSTDVEITYQPSDTVAENFVIDQTPTPDSPMKLGGWTKLKLVVSQGTEMIKIPSVAWQDHTTMYFRLKDELGLEVEEVAEYNEEIGSGMCIRTEPEGEVKKGSKVTLYWSLGPKKEQVIVPNLVGDTYEIAVRKLADAKLKVGETFPEDREGHQGVIEKQSPAAGETVYEDTPVALFFKVEVEEPGDDTPIVEGPGKTITISLPSGYEFGESVRLRIFVANNRTGDESIVKDIENVPVEDFPRSEIIPLPEGGQFTVRAFVNDLLVYENVF